MLDINTVIDDYRIRRVLGTGGFGITYLAEDETLGIPVAIKEFMPGHLATHDGTTIRPIAEEKKPAFDKELDNFIVEARHVARIQHPNIVRVRRCFKRNGSAYMVMDFEEGQSFEEHLRRRDGPPSEEELKEFLVPFLDGLKIVHDQGLVHRDIKPSNIYLRRADGSPVLLDFGAARRQTAAHFTAILTKGYAPIEQYDAKARQGPWTDIYGVAAVLYRAITGDKPLPAVSRLAKESLVPAVKRAAGGYSEAFLRGIDWGLALAPEDRPRDVDAWRAVLLAKSPAAPSPVHAVAVPTAHRFAEAPAVETVPAKHTLDETAWRAAKKADTLGAYLDYLRQHPDGLYRGMADRAVEAIRRRRDEEEKTDPEAAAAAELKPPAQAEPPGSVEVFGRVIAVKRPSVADEESDGMASAWGEGPAWQEIAILGFLALVITILTSIVFRTLIGTNIWTLVACFGTTFAASLGYCLLGREQPVRTALVLSAGTAVAALVLFLVLVLLTA